MNAESKKTKILIIDDDEHTRSMYAEIFQNNNFEVLEAKDGVEGLDVATACNPDVVFTGIVMPRMDGFGLVEALKKNVATSNIPVFVSSHMGREDDKAKALELGAKGFIVRDMTPPNKVVEMISAYFAQNYEYDIEFNNIAEDGKRLIKNLTLAENEFCQKCGGRFVLRLTLAEKKNNFFNVKVFCPKCD